MNFSSKNFYVLSIFLISLVTAPIASSSILLTSLLLTTINATLSSVAKVESLKCYRCTSTDAVKDPYQCNEFFEDSELQPQSCDDVYNAQYCVKQIGRFEGGDGINCFQCDSSWDISCTDMLISDGTLKPESCDRIYDAQFCVKMTGGLGTKRFCSSADLGNYCNYVQQPGDVMEYRSCYFTCSGDGCNSATSFQPFGYFLFFLLSYLTYHLS